MKMHQEWKKGDIVDSGIHKIWEGIDNMEY